MKKYKIILVDDEPWALLGLKEIIDWDAEGFEVIAECSCGLEALERACTLIPSAVITDIKMPDITGINLIKELKKRIPEIASIVVSAYSDFEIARDALRLNAIDYILKPLDEKEVLKAVRKLKVKLDEAVENSFSENIVFSCQSHNSSKLNISDIQLYLYNNLDSDISLKDLSARLYVSETHLCDVFKEETGETIMSFLKNLRITRAKKLLTTTTDSLVVIAEKCGYKDYSYFGKQFKSCVGLSPENYRKTAR